jgi:hypothetical protein
VDALAKIPLGLFLNANQPSPRSDSFAMAGSVSQSALSHFRIGYRFCSIKNVVDDPVFEFPTYQCGHCSMDRENSQSIELMYFRARTICSLVGFDNFLVVLFIGLKGDPLFDFESDTSSSKFQWGFCDRHYPARRTRFAH